MSTKTRRKEEKQAAERAYRKEQQRKKRLIAKEPILEREAPTKQTFRHLLVVTEGVNTEPSYFEQFRLPTLHLVPVGIGDHTCSLVNRVENIRENKEREEGILFDEIWVVFDKDDFDDFDQAINLAQSKGYRIAVSNQAFEYWLLLHFNDHQGGGLPRTRYAQCLNKLINPLGTNYQSKCKIVTSELFDLMMALNPVTSRQRVHEAIMRACRNNQNLDAHKLFSQCESSTTVCGLVKTILEMTDPDGLEACHACNRCGAYPIHDK